VVAIKQGERYNRDKTQERHRDNALFVGFAPAEHPQIVISVMIENGEAGGRVAGPVVRQIMDAWLLDHEGHLKPQYATPSKAPGDPTSDSQLPFVPLLHALMRQPRHIVASRYARWA